MTKVLTSLHGLRVGISKDGHLTGNIDGNEGVVLDSPVTVASTGSNIPNYGTTHITSTAAKTYTMDDPTGSGVTKKIICTGASTSAARTVACSTSVTFDGSNGTLTLLQNTAIILEDLSTTRWGITSNEGVTLS